MAKYSSTYLATKFSSSLVLFICDLSVLTFGRVHVPVYRKLFIFLKAIFQFISVLLVQWLKRSPQTREIVSSSLNSDLLFSCNFIACIDV